MTFKIKNALKLILSLIAVIVYVVFASISNQLPKSNGSGHNVDITQDYTSFGADYYTYQYNASVDTAKGIDTLNNNVMLLLNAQSNTQRVLADVFKYICIIAALAFATVAASTLELKKKETIVATETPCATDILSDNNEISEIPNESTVFTSVKIENVDNNSIPENE